MPRSCSLAGRAYSNATRPWESLISRAAHMQRVSTRHISFVLKILLQEIHCAHPYLGLSVEGFEERGCLQDMKMFTQNLLRCEKECCGVSGGFFLFFSLHHRENTWGFVGGGQGLSNSTGRICVWG